MAPAKSSAPTRKSSRIAARMAAPATPGLRKNSLAPATPLQKAKKTLKSKSSKPEAPKTVQQEKNNQPSKPRKRASVTERGKAKSKAEAADGDYQLSEDDADEDVLAIVNGQRNDDSASAQLQADLVATLPTRIGSTSAKAKKKKPPAFENRLYVDKADAGQDSLTTPRPKIPLPAKRKLAAFEDQAYRDDNPDVDDDIPSCRSPKRTRRSAPPNIDVAAPASTGGEAWRMRNQDPSDDDNDDLRSSTGTGPGGGDGNWNRLPPSPLSKQDSSPSEISSTVPASMHLENARKLFNELIGKPKPLSLAEISALFIVLQQELSEFSKKHFSFELNEFQVNTWPMYQLPTKYQRLLLITQRIADGGFCGWKRFFTGQRHRPYLVNGIRRAVHPKHLQRPWLQSVGENPGDFREP
jgi:hypothetical protein